MSNLGQRTLALQVTLLHTHSGETEHGRCHALTRPSSLRTTPCGLTGMRHVWKGPTGTPARSPRASSDKKTGSVGRSNLGARDVATL